MVAAMNSVGSGVKEDARLTSGVKEDARLTWLKDPVVVTVDSVGLGSAKSSATDHSEMFEHSHPQWDWQYKSIAVTHQLVS